MNLGVDRRQGDRMDNLTHGHFLSPRWRQEYRVPHGLAAETPGPREKRSSPSKVQHPNLLHAESITINARDQPLVHCGRGKAVGHVYPSKNIPIERHQGPPSAVEMRTAPDQITVGRWVELFEP